MMQTMLELIATIDDVARALGALLLLLGTFIVAVYLLTRDRVLVVSVAGDGDDITVPPGDGADGDAVDDAVAELETVLFETSDGTRTDTTGESSPDAGLRSDDPL
jgi:hypothetical protein